MGWETEDRKHIAYQFETKLEIKLLRRTWKFESVSRTWLDQNG